MSRNFKVKTAMGLSRGVSKGHFGFLRRATAFPNIAPNAGAHNIFPRIATPSRSGNNMVERKAVARLSAVLASVIVSV